MKIKSGAFALASAFTAALLWLLCSFFVFIMPGPMMNMSGHMVHGNLIDMTWRLSLTGVFLGLIVWSAFAGLFAWVLAYFYNWLVGE